MFHCNGWCFTWAVTAVAGTHICMRRMDPALVYAAIKREGVTHLCGAPVVLNMLANAPESAEAEFDQKVSVTTGGAAPPSTIIAAMERNGFHVTHAYGLTECYGPGLNCAWHDEWDGLSLEERARLTARQGVIYFTLEAAMVADPANLVEMPWDGQAMGEIFLRGNTVMMGYLKNPSADGHRLRRRLVPYRRSGGAPSRRLYRGQGPLQGRDHLRRREHLLPRGRGGALSPSQGAGGRGRGPARRDMGRDIPAPSSCRGPREAISRREEVIAFCRANMARFKAPRTVVFGPLPKTSTGKIQKYLLRERARSLDTAQG